MKKIILALAVLFFCFYANANPIGQCTSDGMTDWNCVCQIWCSNGDGGAACNCDLLPL